MNIVEALLLSFCVTLSCRVTKYYWIEYRSRVTHLKLNKKFSEFRDIMSTTSSSGKLDAFYEMYPLEYIEFFVGFLENFIDYLEKEKNKLNSKASLMEVDSIVKVLTNSKENLLKELEDNKGEFYDTYKLRGSKKAYKETFKR